MWPQAIPPPFLARLDIGFGMPYSFSMAPKDMLRSAAVEDYSKAIFALQTRTEEPVSTNALAERLAITAVSVSVMLKQGEDLGLICHVPYRGVRVARVSDSDPEMLRYLAEQGIALGDRLRVEDRQPFDGPVFVRFGERQHPIGGRLARAMRVEVDAPGGAAGDAEGQSRTDARPRR